MALQEPNIMPSSRLDCPLSRKTPNMGNTGVRDNDPPPPYCVGHPKRDADPQYT